jgi:hypothetical protein
LWLARTSRPGGTSRRTSGKADSPLLGSEDLRRAEPRQAQQFEQLALRERCALGSALYFDKSTIATADNIHICLSTNIFFVTKIEHWNTINNSYTYSGD